MTYGQLLRAMERIKEHQDRIAEAERSLGFGGREDTIARKRETLSDAQDWFAVFLLEEIE